METLHQKKLLTFCLLVLVGLNLVGCTPSSKQPTIQDQNTQVAVEWEKQPSEKKAKSKRTSEWVIANAINADNYQAFTPELLKQWLDTWKQVVLFFSADWCPLCIKLDKDLKENISSIPDDIVLLTIDYDQGWDLLREYKIRSQHTIVYLDKAWEILLSNIKQEVTLEDVLSTIETLWSTWNDEPQNPQWEVEEAEAPSRPEDQPSGRWWPWWQPPQANLDVNKALIAAREEEATPAEIKVDDSGIKTITAWEKLYAAKVWDSIEAHPAWLTVSVTLENDVITDLNIDQESSSPKSARHQAQFAQQIESVVVGKKLSESNNVYLSVASSTSQAFNDSIDEIQEVYQQSQS